jgi:LmbE family N-acetylglucosaminyl deacetylase
MELHRPCAEVFVPDGTPPAEALARTTHLGVGAHPDDLEIMTWHGIAACAGSGERWFAGVVVTDGAGSARAGRFAAYRDDEMRAARVAEQKRAATLGGYGALLCLDYPSAEVRDGTSAELAADLDRVLAAARPDVVYTHDLFDAHETHVAVAAHVVAAARRLPPDLRPRAVYGCEVWRSLAWLPAEHRVALDVSDAEELGERLVAVFESQIAGGKRYDLATSGRKRANATFAEAREVDRATSVELALDLTPLVRGESGDAGAFALEIARRFAAGAAARLSRFGA